MKRCLHALVGIATLLALALATSAQANPIDATFTNLQHCDSLPTQHFLEELGDATSRVLVSRTTSRRQLAKATVVSNWMPTDARRKPTVLSPDFSFVHYG